ncbi:YgiT-type zinc finger protein [Gloeothece citriformis]|nr:YgiT-type zinc finger protein [Gloeothece citriformis]
MRFCPICSGKTLRHIRHNQIYWYCPHCHQEVPDLRDITPLKTKVGIN